MTWAHLLLDRLVELEPLQDGLELPWIHGELRCVGSAANGSYFLTVGWDDNDLPVDFQSPSKANAKNGGTILDQRHPRLYHAIK